MKLILKGIVNLSILLAMLSGCGYHLRGGTDNLPQDVSTIGILTFENKTYNAEIESTLSLALAEEFSKARRIKVVSESEAELLLSGAVISLSSTPVSFSADDVVSDYRIKLIVDVTLKRGEKGEIIWKGKGLEEVEDYRAEAGNVEDTEINRAEAERLVAAEMAELIYDRVFEGF